MWATFGALYVLVGIGIIAVLVNAAMTAKGLETRARSMEPRDVLERIPRFESDVARLEAAGAALTAFGVRATAASVSIVASLAAMREQVALMRQAFRLFG